MSKIILFDEEARGKIKKGVDQLANAVKVTLGPRGRNVVIDKKFGSPASTKDGVTVAKEIELEDQFENMGAQLVNEVASKTSDIAGDGTTTATVLAQAIFTEGLRNVTAGANPIDLKRGIDEAVESVVAELKKISTMAEAYYVPISPHDASGPINILAGAHVMMTVPNFYKLETARHRLNAYDVFMDKPLNVQNGRLVLPNEPGLGIVMNMDYLLANSDPQFRG